MIGNVQEIAVKEIEPSKFNPRKHFDEQKLKDLTHSIVEKGIIEPLIVRPVDGKYELVCGERRFKASEIAKLKTVPAVIRELTDTQAMEFQVIENLQREDLDPVDEALGYKAMLEKCGYTQGELAAKVGKSQAYIANRMRLLELNRDVQEAISREIISPGHAMVILRVQDPKVRSELFKKVVEQKWSVRRAENELSDFGRELRSVPFDRAECKGCMFQGDNQKDLIDKDTKLKGMCLDPQCFMKKAQAFIQSKRDRLKKKGFQVATEKQLEKKGIGRNNVRELDAYERKELGKAYKTKCLENCPNHWYVIRTHDYGHQEGLQYIEEWCTNPTCCNKLMYPDSQSSSNETAEGKRKQQSQARVRETKRRIWIEQVTKRITDQTATVMVLSHLVHHRAMYDGELLYELGLSKKKDEDCWDIREKLLPLIIKMDSKKMVKAIRQLVLNEDIHGYGDEELNTMALHLGFDIGKDFVIDEEYLKSRTKEQLVAIAKEIKLKPEISANMKKTEMIECYLKKGFDLKGKVPKEIQKKERGE